MGNYSFAEIKGWINRSIAWHSPTLSRAAFFLFVPTFDRTGDDFWIVEKVRAVKMSKGSSWICVFDLTPGATPLVSTWNFLIAHRNVINECNEPTSAIRLQLHEVRSFLETKGKDGDHVWSTREGTWKPGDPVHSNRQIAFQVVKVFKKISSSLSC